MSENIKAELLYYMKLNIVLQFMLVALVALVGYASITEFVSPLRSAAIAVLFVTVVLGLSGAVKVKRTIDEGDSND